MRYFALGCMIGLALACGQTHPPADAGKRGSQASATKHKDAGASRSGGRDAATGADGGCKDRCDARDAGASADGGAAGSGATAGAGAGGSGAGEAGAGGAAQNGGADAATDACVPRTQTTPGTLLVLFDRSLSMNESWNNQSKWQAAGSALIDALTPWKDQLTIGAVLFPSPNAATGAPGSCVDPTGITCAILGGDPAQFCMVSPITAPDQVNFKPGADAIAELLTGANGMPKYQPVGSTPTSEAIDQADSALASATLVGPTAVMIITDGEPNCMWDQTKSTTTIGRWLSEKSIKTYVIGLPGTGTSTNAPMVLDALATAGGTMHYLSPADAPTLKALFGDVLLRQVQVDSAGADCPPCNPACTGDTRCIGGTCRCPNVGDVVCGSACVSTSWDGQHCGMCGHACASAEACCAGECIAVQSSTAHCGACGNSCGNKSNACTNGACACGSGPPCTGTQTCATILGGGGTGSGAMCQ